MKLAEKHFSGLRSTYTEEERLSPCRFTGSEVSNRRLFVFHSASEVTTAYGKMTLRNFFRMLTDCNLVLPLFAMQVNGKLSEYGIFGKFDKTVIK